MNEIQEKLLSSAFGFAIFDKWPDLQAELSSQDDRMMYRALELASMGVGRTHPNPPVGAVVVKDGAIFTEGFHERAGLPHAEAKALKLACEAAMGADLYITLEPCTHHGRTPPCSLAVIGSRVAKARVGTLDPNPKVDGGGLKALCEAGIEARVIENPFLQALAANMIRPFQAAMTQKRPYVVLQMASSLDGIVAARTGQETPISSKSAVKVLHSLRDKCDAVAVGRWTVETDDPRLTVREMVPREERQPLRIVFDSGCKLANDKQIFANGNCVVIHDELVSPPAYAGVKYLGVSRTPDGLDVPESLKKLAEMGLTSILIEGGPRLWTSFLNSGLVDEIWWFDSPLILGAQGVRALENLGPNASDWLSPERHQSRTFAIDRDHLTIMRIQKSL